MQKGSLSASLKKKELPLIVKNDSAKTNISSPPGFCNHKNISLISMLETESQSLSITFQTTFYRLYFVNQKLIHLREAPWSSGEHRGLTIRAMPDVGLNPGFT